jgi:hypothetical protein
MDGGWGWMVVLGKCPNIVVKDVHCTLYRSRILGRKLGQKSSEFSPLLSSN